MGAGFEPVPSAPAGEHPHQSTKVYKEQQGPYARALTLGPIPEGPYPTLRSPTVVTHGFESNLISNDLCSAVTR